MEQDWPGVGQRIRQRRLETGMSQERVTQELAEHGVVVTKAMVSRWEAGEKIAEPEYVFALERVLEFGPGELSRLAGYLPVVETRPVSVSEAIDTDPSLSDLGRTLLRAALRTLRESEQGS